MPSPTDIPEAVLRATYTREQPYRLHWPQDYAAGMADPIIAAIVRTLARHVPTYGRRSAERARIGLGGGPIKGPIQPELTACESCGGTGWWTTYEGQPGEVPRRVSVPCPQGCTPTERGKRCEPCRATGAIHCADPENCGGPWDKRHDRPAPLDNKRRASGEKESDYD